MGHESVSSAAAFVICVDADHVNRTGTNDIVCGGGCIDNLLGKEQFVFDDVEGFVGFVDVGNEGLELAPFEINPERGMLVGHLKRLELSGSHCSCL